MTAGAASFAAHSRASGNPLALGPRFGGDERIGTAITTALL
jgi:hypothetical protein